MVDSISLLHSLTGQTPGAVETGAIIVIWHRQLVYTKELHIAKEEAFSRPRRIDYKECRWTYHAVG